jgi:TRAP-type mannitol/chloroaromatic compound transport system permease small subunit
MHTFFFMPFLIVAMRLLWDYGRKGLGMRWDGTWPDGWRVWNTWETAWDAGSLPIGPIKALTFVGMVLFALQVLAEIIKTGFVMINREELADIHDHDEFQRIE